MDTPRKRAERILSIITTAIDKDPVVKDLYYEFSFEIIQEQEDCFVPVTDYYMAWCKKDGDVALIAAKGNEPIMGEIPVLSPLTQESFTLALMYAINVRKLKALQTDQRILRKLSGKDDFDNEGGLLC